MGGQAAKGEDPAREGLKVLGAEFVKGCVLSVAILWKPYLNVLAEQAVQALHVLDRFHITMHMNQAVDEVRRSESSRLLAHSQQEAQRWKHIRWRLLRKGSRVRGKARQRLHALLASKLVTARAWELKEAFQYFWKHRSVLEIMAKFVSPRTCDVMYQSLLAWTTPTGIRPSNVARTTATTARDKCRAGRL